MKKLLLIFLAFSSIAVARAATVGFHPNTKYLDQQTLLLNAADGSATAPSWTFSLDKNSGIYSSAADVIGFSTGGAERMLLSSTALTINGNLISGATTLTPTELGFLDGPTSGIQAQLTTLFGRTLTIAGTANEITSSAGAQDLSANRTWTLSLPTALTFTGKTVTGGIFTGGTVGLVASGFNGNLDTTDDTLQEVAQKFDDFAGAGGGSGDVTAAANFGTDNAVIVSQGTSKGVESVPGFTIDPANGNFSTTGTGSFGADDGVSLIGANGIVTELGLGDGADENMVRDYNTTANEIGISSTTGAAIITFAGLSLVPSANDGAALGSATRSWSDLFLASGGLINFANGNYTLTHASGILTANGALSIGTGNAFTAGTIELGAATDTTISRSAAGIIAVEGVDQVNLSATQTLTGKTFDASGTGNVLKFTSYQDFVFPARVDGVGATISTNNYTSSQWGLASYSGTATDTNANYAIFRVGTVPYDLDTSVAMVLKGLSIRVSGTDTTAAEFSIGLYSPASSSIYLPTDFTGFSTFIDFDSGTLTSPVANDIFYLSDVTLTGWAAALTPGRPLLIAIARRNDANANFVVFVSGTIASGRTQ